MQIQRRNQHGSIRLRPEFSLNGQLVSHQALLNSTVSSFNHAHLPNQLSASYIVVAGRFATVEFLMTPTYLSICLSICPLNCLANFLKSGMSLTGVGLRPRLSLFCACTETRRGAINTANNA